MSGQSLGRVDFMRSGGTARGYQDASAFGFILCCERGAVSSNPAERPAAERDAPQKSPTERGVIGRASEATFGRKVSKDRSSSVGASVTFLTCRPAELTGARAEAS
jgi:hypothetical protein